MTSFITSRNITDLRSAIRLSLLIAHQPSVSILEMSSQSDNADHSQRLFASMSSRRKSNISKETLRKFSSSSEYKDFYLHPYASLTGKSLTIHQRPADKAS